MNCERIEKEFIAYLDGRASAAERQSVETHLQGCAACRTRAEEFRRLWNVLDEAPVLEPSFGFDARLRQRIAAEPKPRLWNWFVPAPRLALSMALLVVLSAYISTRPPDPPAPGGVTAQSEDEFKMIKDLGVLENYDVLSDLDALSELPPATPQQQDPQNDPVM